LVVRTEEEVTRCVKQNVVVTEEGTFDKHRDMKSEEQVGDKNTALVDEAELVELLAGLEDVLPGEVDLRVETCQHLPHEHPVGVAVH